MNGELIEFLDKKFNKIDGKFDRINERFDKVENKLEKIQTDVNINKTNILVGFKEAKEERSGIERRINETYNSVDGFVKNVDDLQDEFTVTKEDSKRIKNVLREKLGVDLA